MYIGEVSKNTGLSIKAIRFYEEKKLIPKPKRDGRYRIYDQSDIDILLLIKEAKSLGITLAKLKSIVVYSDGQLDWVEVKEFLKLQRNLIVEQIKALNLKIEKIDDCINQINV